MWRFQTGVPQGSVLGPILFNDLDDDITSNVLKFADDKKLFRKIKSDADRQHFQDDLNKLTEWFETWQMLFKFGKCRGKCGNMSRFFHTEIMELYG